MIKASDTSAELRLGKNAVALDEDIAAFGSDSAFQKVFVFNISVNPAEELGILSSPDSTSADEFGHTAVAVSRQYGILVGAEQHDIGGMLYSNFHVTLPNIAKS